MPRTFVLPRALALGLLCVTAAVQAELRYRIQDLGLPPGFDRTSFIRPMGLNNRGDVVGVWESGGPDTQSFLYRNGRMEWLGADLQTYVYANALNDRGQVVGSLRTAQGRRVPFLYANGRFRTLGGTLGGPGPGDALDINAAGQVVGFRSGNSFVFDGVQTRRLDVPGLSNERPWVINDQGLVAGTGLPESVPNSISQVFLHEPGGTRLLPLPPVPAPYFELSVTSINSAGQLAVVARSDGATRSYLWDEGRYTLLRGLSFQPDTRLNALNDKGWGVGNSIDFIPGNGIRSEAFLWRGGKTVNLNELVRAEDAQRWSLRDATAINERGQIVGYGFLDGGLGTHAFLATPVPEPAAWALWLAGLALTGCAARRRAAATAAAA